MVSRCSKALALALVLAVPEAEASRKQVATPPWACAVTKCSLKAVQEDIADADPPLNGNLRKALLGVKGAVNQQVLCPFGGDDPNAKKASKAEVKSFFDGFGAAYDKLHGIKSDDKKEETKQVATQAPSVKAAPSSVAAAAAPPPAPTTTVAPVVAAPGAVEKVDKQSLTKLIEAHDQDLLVVFYAPWCPHCQALVLADHAPLETMAQELAGAHGPKVVTFDATAGALPMGFNVQFIPTIMKIFKDGRRSEFMEDPEQVEHLKTFALANQ